MTEEEMNAEFENYPHGELVRAVYQMKTELLNLYGAVNTMAERQALHDKVLAVFVEMIAEGAAAPAATTSDDAPQRPGMYL